MSVLGKSQKMQMLFWKFFYFSLLVTLNNSFIHLPNIWHKIMFPGISYDHPANLSKQNVQQSGLSYSKFQCIFFKAVAPLSKNRI